MTVTSPSPTDLLVSPSWLAASLRDARIRVMDCTATLVTPAKGPGYVESGREAWERAHIPGAAYLDLIEDLSAPEPGAPFNLPHEAQITDRLQRAGVNQDSTVVLYGGAYFPAVSRAWWVLKASGVRDVRVLQGGLAAWQAAGLPLGSAADAAAPERGDWVAQRQAHWLVERDELLALVNGQATTLVNALPRAMFQGTSERHYGRPGRLPGSVSVPATHLLDEHGQLLDADRLRATLDAAGASATPEVVAYCGAGINASVTVFALALIGHPTPRLYDRSLMEWARDPSLPMVTD